MLWASDRHKFIPLGGGNEQWRPRDMGVTSGRRGLLADAGPVLLGGLGKGPPRADRIPARGDTGVQGRDNLLAGDRTQTPSWSHSRRRRRELARDCLRGLPGSCRGQATAGGREGQGGRGAGRERWSGE